MASLQRLWRLLALPTVMTVARVAATSSYTSSDTRLELSHVLGEAEELALRIRDDTVKAFDSRCVITIRECEGLHYSACHSRLPEPDCTTEDIMVDDCAENGCGFVEDFSTPVVQLPAHLMDGPNKNPTNLDVIETMCYTMFLDSTLQDALEQSQSGGGVSSRFTIFGSWTGLFRIYPGSSYDEECGEYDPRIRPWYVAASSGPKDVVIVMDTSSSMRAENRFELAKDAVVSVLGTMNEHTFVNIVTFSSTTEVLTEERRLYRATSENLELLKGKLNNIQAKGTTHIESALTTTFDLLEKSRALGEEGSSQCSVAIILLSDGSITIGKSADELVTMVEDLNEGIDARIFTFALGAEADHENLKTIACGTGGIYQAIPDGGSLSTAMSFYYRFYAIGLGYNQNYTAYSSLYNFTSGTGGYLGFTVGSPTYDHKSDPPAFLGVAGVDFTLQSLLDMGFSLTDIEEEVHLGGRDCPVLFNLTDCQLERFRGSISADSVCTDDCNSDGESLEPERCMNEDEYPDNLWDNHDLAGWSAYERNCCDGPLFDPDAGNWTCLVAESPEEESDPWVKLGVLIGVGVVAIAILLACTWCCVKRRHATKMSGPVKPEANQ